MAKPKGAASSAVGNRPAYSRVSFLYQAAALLAAKSAAPLTTSTNRNDADNSTDMTDDVPTAAPPATPAAPLDPNLMGMSRRLLTQMRSVSRKTNMRLRPAVKHRVCKYCDTLLVEGATCTSTVENPSRGGRKPWADVLAVACTTCGRVRRFPVSASRQPRRPLRGAGGEEAEQAQQAQQASMQVDAALPAKKETKQKAAKKGKTADVDAKSGG